MAENQKSFNQHLSDLAEIADKVEALYKGKATIVFELNKPEFDALKYLLEPNAVESDRFKLDISGTEFIYLLDMS
jgi:hypothetical protein